MVIRRETSEPSFTFVFRKTRFQPSLMISPVSRMTLSTWYKGWFPLKISDLDIKMTHTSGTCLNFDPVFVIFTVIQEPLYRTRRIWSSSFSFWTSILQCWLSDVLQKESRITERPCRFFTLFCGISSCTIRPGSSITIRSTSWQKFGSSAIFVKNSSSIGFRCFILSAYFQLFIALLSYHRRKGSHLMQYL